MKLMGFVSIDKPSGITSHDVVDKLRKLLHIKRIGHGGTLDPIATGVLPVAIGEMTRFLEFIPDRTKVYLAEFTFGIGTDSYDLDGKILEKQEYPAITGDLIKGVLDQFLGIQEQVPPMVSAKHYKGKRLYQLAREGKIVDVPPKQVTIDEFTLLEFTEDVHPKGLFRIQCSEGTYVRALARDIGKALGVSSVLSWLKRIRSGPFCIEDSLSLEKIESIALQKTVKELFLPIEKILSLPAALLGAKDLFKIIRGNPVTVPKRFLPYSLGSRVLIHGDDRRCYGVGILKGAVTAGFVTLHPLKMLAINNCDEHKVVNSKTLSFKERARFS